MNEQIAILVENYKDGVPVKVERSTVVLLSAATILTVAICALIIKYINKL